MNISCRIANANTQCGRITNPPEREHVGNNIRITLMNLTTSPPQATALEDYEVQKDNML